MKFVSINNQTLPLIITGFVTFLFFIGGLCDILHLFIIKALLFTGFAGLLIATVYYAQKNRVKKNRLEDLKTQDDFINI